MLDFTALGAGWFLQWAAQREYDRNPGYNVQVIDENGRPLCGVVGLGNLGDITLIADNSKIYGDNHANTSRN